jgi:LysM repeat protein
MQKKDKVGEDTSDNVNNPLKEAKIILRDNRDASSKRNDRLLLRYIVGLFVLIVLLTICIGIQLYYLSQQFNEMTISLRNLEGRIANIEKQNSELQTKISNSAIANKVETQVNTLEKQITQSQPDKKSSTDSSKKSKAVKKRYHEVKRGETLYRISKQYGLTVDELRRLNMLSPNQPIEAGQKLLVSRGGI